MAKKQLPEERARRNVLTPIKPGPGEEVLPGDEGLDLTEGQERGRRLAEREQRIARGRAATVLTGARGLEDEDEPSISRRTLLGI